MVRACVMRLNLMYLLSMDGELNMFMHVTPRNTDILCSTFRKMTWHILTSFHFLLQHSKNERHNEATNNIFQFTQWIVAQAHMCRLVGSMFVERCNKIKVRKFSEIRPNVVNGNRFPFNLSVAWHKSSGRFGCAKRIWRTNEKALNKHTHILTYLYTR